MIKGLLYKGGAIVVGMYVTQVLLDKVEKRHNKKAS